MDLLQKTFNEFSETKNFLFETGEISLSIAMEDNFRKVLILSAASYFEHRLCEIVSEFVAKETKNHDIIVSFLKNKAISRQYHTWFNWQSSNGNQFYGLFGDNFKKHMTTLAKGNEEFSQAVVSFIEIGSLRNNLVHNNFASISIEKTPEEIFEIVRQANEFIDFLKAEFAKFQTDG